jgi:hypothetical protein
MSIATPSRAALTAAYHENLLSLLPAAHVEGTYGCLDYYQNVSDPFSKTLLGHYNDRYVGREQFTGLAARQKWCPLSTMCTTCASRRRRTANSRS